jgi:hypothetical protein
VLQLQALVDQFPLEESSVAEKLLYIFCIDIPAKWELEVSYCKNANFTGHERHYLFKLSH